MARLVDITGLRFNSLTVLHKVKARSTASAYWMCLCDCGNQSIVAGIKLKSGSTKSCGCYKLTLKTQLKHGMANKTRTYRTWKEMRQRCLNPNSDKWKWYGGRGIIICQRWLDSYEAFLSDMGERPNGKTLDRLNSDGNYEPGNCRWATPKQQAETNRGCFKKGLAK